MVDLTTLVNRGFKQAATHSPEILTGLGIGGVVTTAYLAAKAAFKSAGRLESSSPYDSNFEKAKEVWPEFIPPVLAGTATIACIFGSNRVSAQRTAAAIAAYSLTEKAFTEYKDKIVDTIGAKKEEKARDEVAEANIAKSPPPPLLDAPVFWTGDVLCCDLLTMRYFQSDMESLNKAANEINARMLREGYMSVAEFYHEIGVRPTDHMDRLGWRSPRLMELTFTAVMTEEDNPRPCMAFAYNYMEPV